MLLEGMSEQLDEKKSMWHRMFVRGVMDEQVNTNELIMKVDMRCIVCGGDHQPEADIMRF